MRVIDMHCDTISKIYYARENGEQAELRNNSFHLDLEKMRNGDYFLQNFALFIDLGKEKDPFQTCMKMMDTFYSEMDANRDMISPVTRWEEIENNWNQGKMSALLTVEEGETCLGDVRLLRCLYRMGVRMMTLTWNYENSLAWPGKGGGIPETEKGLKEKGEEILAEMEQIGIIPDVSHLSDAGIWDVLRLTKKPFVASHSNARAQAPHSRNLTDDMIRAIAERGGVIGINFCSAFLDHFGEGEIPVSRVSSMIRHMKHIKNIGGIGCLGLGSDFDGIRGNLELDSANKLLVLAEAMEDNGFTDEEIRAVFHGNVLRLYREWL